MSRTLELALRIVAAASLAVVAYVHLDLAGTYDAIAATVSQGALFRLEAALAVLAAVVVLVPAHRWTYLPALLVAAGSLAAVLVYRYVDVGALGPLPNMYEPVWFTQKTVAALAAALGMLAAAIGLATSRARRPAPTSTRSSRRVA